MGCRSTFSLPCAAVPGIHAFFPMSAARWIFGAAPLACSARMLPRITHQLPNGMILTKLITKGTDEHSKLRCAHRRRSRPGRRNTGRGVALRLAPRPLRLRGALLPGWLWPARAVLLLALLLRRLLLLLLLGLGLPVRLLLPLRQRRQLPPRMPVAGVRRLRLADH